MISDTDRADYERDGVICVRNVIAPDLAAEMLAACAELMAGGPKVYDTSKTTRIGESRLAVPNEPGRFFSGVFMSHEYPKFEDFALRSALPKAAGELMQSRTVRFFYDQLFVKDPGTVSPTPWHHDMPFWPLSGEHLISGWVALTRATYESSGLEYVAGSHRWSKWYRPAPDLVDGEVYEDCPDFSLPENREGQRFLSWDMEPGDVLFHHPLAVHGAGGNRTQDQQRVGLSIRYIGDNAKWSPRPKAMKLPRDPNVEPGAYPADDRAFPLVWTSQEPSAERERQQAAL